MGLHSEAKLTHKFSEFAKLMNVYLNHFPKAEKYGLAQAIRQAAYDLDARQGKRSTYACYQFERRFGAQIEDLHRRLEELKHA